MGRVGRLRQTMIRREARTRGLLTRRLASSRMIETSRTRIRINKVNRTSTISAIISRRNTRTKCHMVNSRVTNSI